MKGGAVMRDTKPKKEKKDKRTFEERKIDELIEKLAAEADDAAKAAEVQRLMNQREEIKNKKRSKIDPNTVIGAGVGLVQVCTIVGYERFHALTSKALTFVQKGRLR